MPFAPICTAAQVPIKLLALGPAGAELALSMPPVRRTKYSTSAEQYAVYERVVRFPIRRPLEVSNQASRADSWLDLTDGFGAPCQTSSSTALGRFSDVYRLHHRDIGAVAVKRLRYTRRDESLHKKMLAKEGAVLKQPRHEYILPFFGYCVPMDSLCIVTLWADHGSLRSYLMRYPFADRLLLLSQVASALSYLHTRTPRIVHGDLHVDNVLVSASGCTLLSDFGISRILSEYPTASQTSASNDLGCRRMVYLAPELHDAPDKRPRITTVHGRFTDVQDLRRPCGMWLGARVDVDGGHFVDVMRM